MSIVTVRSTWPIGGLVNAMFLEGLRVVSGDGRIRGLKAQENIVAVLCVARQRPRINRVITQDSR